MTQHPAEPTGLQKAASEEQARIYGRLCPEHVSYSARRVEENVDLIVELAKRLTG